MDSIIREVGVGCCEAVAELCPYFDRDALSRVPFVPRGVTFGNLFVNPGDVNPDPGLLKYDWSFHTVPAHSMVLDPLRKRPHRGALRVCQAGFYQARSVPTGGEAAICHTAQERL